MDPEYYDIICVPRELLVRAARASDSYVVRDEILALLEDDRG